MGVDRTAGPIVATESAGVLPVDTAISRMMSRPAAPGRRSRGRAEPVDSGLSNPRDRRDKPAVEERARADMDAAGR
ncbi:hypothetical protein [Natrinema soli]|uniref:Uncharacterized protein n=1 Tax=Natrinema soli TaxID=1930624 RepID=A0ABD5SK54_9EURY|nr:hypothetical protein [Natrinema soli]